MRYSGSGPSGMSWGKTEVVQFGRMMAGVITGIMLVWWLVEGRRRS